MRKNIEITVRNQIMVTVEMRSFKYGGKMLKIKKVYLLPLLLTYHCILAYVTVQAYNITLQLICKSKEKNVMI